MLRRISVENFRALREFRMAGLGRVNLLVGTNNCGKTSILEAIHTLASPGLTRGIWNALVRRGETVERANGGGREVEGAVAHIINGHQIREGVAFSISGENDHVRRSVVASFHPAEAPERAEPGEAYGGPGLELRLEWQREGDAGAAIRWRLTSSSSLPFRPSMALGTSLAAADRVAFITTEGLPRDKVVPWLEDVMLTDEETWVLAALRTIDPKIEGIAPVGAGVVLKVGQRIPIGSMGDGIWRLLGIALALVRARGGTLLVDEIDTGLHYTVLTKMWRLVLETAARLDVQVFATTHSRDCYEALAEVAEPGRHDVSLQRIERDKPEAIAYSAGMLRQAAEHAIEVR